MVSSDGVAAAVPELVVSLAVSGEEVEMSPALGVESGGEIFPLGEAVNIQPPARAAETIIDVTINATCHLILFMFALCIMQFRLVKKLCQAEEKTPDKCENKTPKGKTASQKLKVFPLPRWERARLRVNFWFLILSGISQTCIRRFTSIIITATSIISIINPRTFISILACNKCSIW